MKNVTLISKQGNESFKATARDQFTPTSLAKNTVNQNQVLVRL